MASIWCCPSPVDPADPDPRHGPARAVAVLTGLGFEFGTPQPASRSLLDTPDGRLHRARTRLDARPVYQPGSTDAVELVARGGPLADRRIIVGHLPRHPDDVPPGRFRDHLADLVGPRALTVRLELSSQVEHALQRNADGKAVARLELHRDVVVRSGEGAAPSTIGHRGGAPGTWCLELHEVPDHSKHAARARRALRDAGLTVVATDALGWAASHAGIDLDGIDTSADVALGRRTRADEAVRAVLHRLGDVVDATWQGAADGVDDEFLHDLRTALRRARTVAKTAADVLPETTRLAALALADSLAACTGEARDLDVLVSHWDGHLATLGPDDADALAAVRPVLEQRRAEAHAALAATLGDIDRRRWVGEWHRLLDAPADLDRPSDARRSVGAVIAERLRRAARRLRRDGRRLRADSPIEEFHRLRKDAKRVRGLVECFGSLIGRRHRRDLVARLKDVQDHLGALQDLEVQRQQLARLTADPAVGLGSVAALGRLGAAIDERAAELRKASVAALRRLDRTPARRATRRVIDDLRAR